MTFSELSNESKITSLPTNAASNKQSYREGTEAGDNLKRRMAEVNRMKSDVSKGLETTSSKGYTVEVGGRFKLTEYCDAEKMSKREYSYLTDRLSGKKKQPHALATDNLNANARRYKKKVKGKKVAAKKVGRKTGF